MHGYPYPLLKRRKTLLSVADFRDGLSEHMKRVTSGTTLVLTLQGKPVAQVTPFEPGEDGKEQQTRRISTGLAKAPERELPEDFFRARTIRKPR